jgi:hypothetical protein
VALAAAVFDAWLLPWALGPTATDELARAAEVAWWAFSVLLAGTASLAAAQLLPLLRAGPALSPAAGGAAPAPEATARPGAPPAGTPRRDPDTAPPA